MKTLAPFGDEYPVMAELGNGWHLVAHPNGPAIARFAGWQWLGHLAHCGPAADEVPNAIRYRAVDALMKWAKDQPTWPAIPHETQSKTH